jgi:tetratricopeptide (TPR) repeat protein
MPGTIGPYLLEREIGRGGMGVVFLARSPGRGAVAIKVLTKIDADKLARFERERRLLETLGTAEGFIPLVDAGVSPSGPYIVMPFANGGTLRQRLVGPLGIDETLRLGAAIARALGHAHERGIVHRDLKPENILFDEQGTVLVADLGLAKHFDREAKGASLSASLSRGGFLRGTAGYMAPEQMVDSKSVGPEADVFALGAILYECLAGRPAFEGESLVEVLARVTSGDREPLGRVRDGVPPWLVAVIDRALARDPARRQPDGRHLAAALENEAEPRRPGRRARALPWAVLVAGVLLGLGLGAGRLLGTGARALVERADLEASRGEKAAALADYGRAIAADPHYAKAWHARALLQEQLGDPAAALADYTRAIEADPGHAGSRFNRALLEQRSGQTATALVDLDRAIELAPREAPFWACRAQVRVLRGDRGGIADAAHALELDPRYAPAWRILGCAKADQGDDTGSIADLTRAIEADPRFAPAWCDRALEELKLYDDDRAHADLERAVAVDPKYAPALYHLGRFEARLGNDDRAFEDFSRAVKADPRLVDAWYYRALVQQKRGDDAAMLADLTRAVEADPKNVRAWADRGACKGKMGDDVGALADLSRAIGLDPRYASAWLNRGVIEAKRGAFETAMASVTRANEADPKLAEAWLLRASLEEHRGRREYALDAFKTALGLGLGEEDAADARKRVAFLEKELGRKP